MRLALAPVVAPQLLTQGSCAYREATLATRHREGAVLIPAPPDDVFAFVDDHSRFSSHMSQSSWMMGGGRMLIVLDNAKGQAVGSHIGLSGTVLGIRLSLDEVVTRRSPPTDKVWETVGTPRLLVIGAYTMGIHITPEKAGHAYECLLTTTFQPDGPRAGWGSCSAASTPSWCVGQMLEGASNHFGAYGTVAAALTGPPV